MSPCLKAPGFYNNNWITQLKLGLHGFMKYPLRGEVPVLMKCQAITGERQPTYKQEENSTCP